MKIKTVNAREILDSRGNPTIEVDVTLADGSFGRAAVPSGASTGEREALELRDGDRSRYGGKGVRTAVGNVNGEIAKAVVNRELDQRSLDGAMIALDGTPAKSRLGANALLGVSMAAARAEAAARRQPLYTHLGGLHGNSVYTLPAPMMNILNGGAHADSSVDFQEFMVMPLNAPSFGEALRWGAEIFHALRGILKARGQSTGVGDEGGFAPNLKSNREAVEVVLEAIGKTGLKAGADVWIALDVASSELWKGSGKYTFQKSGEPDRTSDEMIRLATEKLVNVPNAFPRSTNGMDLADYEDELFDFVYSYAVFQHIPSREVVFSYLDRVGNALLVKLNQIGTVSETLDAVRMASEAKYGTIISHRSGETEDTTIADLAVGTGAGQIKTGSASRTDRVCKYNQLLRIEQELGMAAVYAGRSRVQSAHT